jgi:hypothetical protein
VTVVEESEENKKRKEGGIKMRKCGTGKHHSKRM